MQTSEIDSARLQIKFLLLMGVRALHTQQATYTLKATPKTVAWGDYDADS